MTIQNFGRFCFVGATATFLSIAVQFGVLGNSTPAALAQTAEPVAVVASNEVNLTSTLGRVDKTLEVYRAHSPNTRQHGPWELMHWIVAYGVDTPVLVDGPSGDPMTAIGWLCFNARAAGQRLLHTNGNSIGVLNGPGVQGHDGQFLAILAQSRLVADYPLKVDDRDFTVADLVEYEKRTCRPNSELTFKLIGLSYYLEPDATWTSDTGEQWTIERLVSEEIDQPIRGAACGGSHRLFGLAFAVAKRKQQGLPIEGEFARAEKYLSDYRKYTLKLQNSDGSFSTNWSQGRGQGGDLDTQLYSTGHTLEWMALSAPDAMLAAPEMVRAVDFLCALVEDTDRNWAIGSLGHAVHGLSLYRERMRKINALAQAQ